ncbi:cupin domain-containing protein [Actinoplanes sp. G11-F43]|uniref:cupin domain-containing protein n=1 Tax=Actinoplanes sp. G11-F43 TaxID=3424130 RepID=UPI003D33429A
MTYPPPRYLGESGLTHAAQHRPHTAEPDYVDQNGTRIHYLNTGPSTGGLFGVYRWECGPGEAGPDPHFHRTITESFYILSGVMSIYNGTEWIDAEPHDWVHVPIGGVHGFKNRSGAPVSMLLHFSPGAPREGYFEGLANLGEMNDDERAAFFLEHDNHWV